MSSPVASQMYPRQQQRQQPPPPPQGGMAGAPSMMEMMSPQFGNLYPLRAQIEFYFSPQNLAKDTFLLSQLNMSSHIGAVPMQVLCSFPKVRQIYALFHNMGHLPLHMVPMADPMMVHMALQQSAVVAVSQDGAWISPKNSSWTQFQQSRNTNTAPSSSVSEEQQPRAVTSTPSSPSSQATASSSLGVPTHPLPPAAAMATTTSNSNASTGERNVVIVRDLPSTVTPEEVVQAFRSESIEPKGARGPDVGNTWFVTFETEEQAVKALDVTRNATIGGVPVQGRLKSDNGRSSQPPQEGPQQPKPPATSTSSSDSVGNASVEGAVTGNSNSAHLVTNLGMPPMMQQPMHMMYPMMLPPGYAQMPMPQQQQQPPLSYGYVTPYPMMQPQPPMRGVPPQQQYYHYAPGYPPANPGYGPPPRAMAKNNGGSGYHHYSVVQGGGNPPPPPHVDVRGERQSQNGPSTNNNQACNRNNSGNNNYYPNNNNNSNDHQQGKKNKRVQTNRRNQQQQQQQTEQIQSSESGESSGEKKGTFKKKQQNSQRQQQAKRKMNTQDVKINLGNEHFPALGSGGGGNVSTSSNQQKDGIPKSVPPVSGGYAQALLKQKVASSANSSSVPKATSEPVAETTLDAAMSKLAFSAEDSSKAAYDDW